MVSFSGCVDIEGLKVDGSSWLAIFLSADYHAVAPCDWFSNGYRFEDS